MIYFLTYGDNKFEKSKKRIQIEATNMELFDKVLIKSPVDLSSDLPELTKKVLSMQRGGGYWIWKPIIIKDQLDKMNKNDILVYVDSGCTLNINGINRLKEYFNMVMDENKPIVRFKMDIPENKYTTTAIFDHFKVNNNKSYTDSGQYMATAIIMRKCDLLDKIIKYWYITAIKYPLLFTDHFNNYNRKEEFIDNRHDQSIFSIITKLFYKNVNTVDDKTYPYNKDEPIYASRIRG
jgi:hypothetical protein